MGEDGGRSARELGRNGSVAGVGEETLEGSGRERETVGGMGRAGRGGGETVAVVWLAAEGREWQRWQSDG